MRVVINDEEYVPAPPAGVEAKLARIRRLCEGDAEGEHGYTGRELAEVILDIIKRPLDN